MSYHLLGAVVRTRPARRRVGFTLVEMLVAITITLVMMATVVGVFATLSSSVTKRQAVIEVNNQVRQVRNTLQRDLAGITCPTLPWTKPESNAGYFEYIEGIHCDFFPSDLTDDLSSNPIPGEIDHASSTLPASNTNFALSNPGWVTDGGGLGDYDDVLAFTSRNEKEPFSGPAPKNNVNTNDNDDINQQNPFANWGSQAITSPVAEVIWFCVENPAVDTGGYFGTSSEQGFRTIYRRTLLVAPWLNYYYNVDDAGNKSRPGVLRILTNLADETSDQAEALAALIAFQERYDISARIEFDHSINAPDGCWTIKANTLADLTKRENRYEHHGFAGDASSGSRNFPFVMVSAGGGSTSSVRFIVDRELSGGGASANPRAGSSNEVLGFDVRTGGGYPIRPLAILDGGSTARAVVNEPGPAANGLGQVVHLTTGLVPLSITGPNQSRRGNDLMLSDVLGFDVRVYDPQSPIYALNPNGSAVQNGDSVDPATDITSVDAGDVGWRFALNSSDPMQVGEGAFVDLGYLELHELDARRWGVNLSNLPFTISSPYAGLPHAKSKLNDARLTRVYDTWSFSYENDGVNQDGDDLNGVPMVDEGTDGFDSFTWYDMDGDGSNDSWTKLLGADDMAERETSPPYPAPLRAVQVSLRVYEPDSGQIREVTVRQHFVPE
ncbi:prepilin-type N-terminal cleavage/methylation domain-containing protein [Aeoliella mucimassa]|uniref:prepilin-type N-terminal cleavage/methylation domain-containing protein n=1 Tax=Aeoliella mucimassa TaxID=2527972 RepID=UPI0011A9CC14|nr:prepilin-type N-terminal cleavage/methylation domain-containing protein [Aeoliella mucimassa]